MIGELQGDFGDLDKKYLKKNIPKYLNMSVENIRKLQENTAALYTERKTLAGKCYQKVWICLSGEVEASSSPIRP